MYVISIVIYMTRAVSRKDFYIVKLQNFWLKKQKIILKTTK